MIYDLARASREILAADAVQSKGGTSLLGRLTDLLFYGDFEIFEQVASISDFDHTNLLGFKSGSERSTGGLLLSAPLGIPEPAVRAARPAHDVERPVLRDGRIWGAAANSGRLALICQLMAASSFSKSELRLPVMVAGTFGDEHRSSGTRFLLESGHVAPDWVVVGGPTNLEVVRAHRGYLLFEVSVGRKDAPWSHGFPVRAGHHVVVKGVGACSAFAGAGRSALTRAFDIIDELRSTGPCSVHGLSAGPVVNRVPIWCEFDVLLGGEQLPTLPWDVAVEPLADGTSLSPAVTDLLDVWRRMWTALRAKFAARPIEPTSEFEPGHPLLNTGLVESTAEGLRILFDYRPLPGEDAYTLFREVEELAAELSTEDGPSLDVRVTVNRPPMDMPDSGELVQAARTTLAELGTLPVTTTLPVYTDGAMYASCDLDAAVLGPGWWGDAAAFGAESVPLQQLELAVEAYRGLIRRLCC